LNEAIRGRSWHETKILVENPRKPKQLPRFCTRCGSDNISACKECKRPIEKQYRGLVPAYCGGCGRPFPWTEGALAAAKQYANELDILSAEEKGQLAESIADLTSDTPRTPLAANRVRGFFEKIGKPAAQGLMQIAVSIITEEAKKQLGLK
jgi:hypothetical protein